MTIALPIDEALRDDRLLGAALGDPASWPTWLTVLRSAHGLPLNEQQREIFAAVSGNRTPPTRRVRTVVTVVGRGGGKSKIAGAINAHTATLMQHKLSKGETGYVLCLSQTTGQAKVVFDYTLGYLEASPVLRNEIASTTANEIRLKSGIIIAVHPNSYRSVRGRSLLACIFDECAFWRDETSALPDIEAYRAVMPSLIRTNGMLVCISTPYRKLGLLYEQHRKYFGVDDPDTLVVQGDSRTFNPLLSETAIAQALADDPQGSISEWQAEFRAEIAAFLDDHDIDACIDFDRPSELPPRPGIDYQAFIDPSGGRHDVFALAIGHKENERTIVDVLRGRHPPFDPRNVVDEYSALLREYHVRSVTGDNYAAQWVEQSFKDAGIKYVRSDLPKGRLYVEGLPAFTRRTISLPDHPRLLRELRLLERRTHVGGKDSVDHGRTGSDDLANVVFGVLNCAQRPRQYITVATLQVTPNVPSRWIVPPPGKYVGELRPLHGMEDDGLSALSGRRGRCIPGKSIAARTPWQIAEEEKRRRQQ